MNFRELAKSLELEDEEYLELVELFIETGTSDLDKFESAIEAGDANAAADAAHSLKGAAGGLGLTALFELAKEAEQKTRNGFMEEIAYLSRSLKTKLDEIASLIRK
ncbi:MAG TPA: Hpt domain-containing protein [Desulfobacterales bacterium]|nr:Hpt domain-containing protein [Desulfobacterales bacterium]